MAVDLTNLQNAVARNNTVDGSASELLRQIPQMMRDAIAADDITDASNINALAAQLEASSDALVGAILENTPQQPAKVGEELPPLPEPGGDTGGGA